MSVLGGIGAASAIAARPASQPHLAAATPASPLERGSIQTAQAGVLSATKQLDTDVAPRGTPGAIAADQAAVMLAEATAEQAASRLRADAASVNAVNVLA